MEAKKKRVMTKPLSELQLNMLKQGRTLFFFNSIVYRLKFPDCAVAGLMTSEQRQRLQLAAHAVSSIKQEILLKLSMEAGNISKAEIKLGVRCANCNTAGSKIKIIDQGAGPYAMCKNCGHSWQVNNK